MCQIVLAFSGGDGVEKNANRFPEHVACSGRGLAKQRLQLCKELLDGVQIRRVWREIEQAGAHRPDRLSDTGDLVNREVIQDDDIARAQARREHLLDIGPEQLAGHWSLQRARGDHAVTAQTGNESCRVPVTVRRRIDQAFASRAPAIQTRHRRCNGRLVQKHEGRRVHVALPDPPTATLPGDIRPVLLARSQRLFLCDRPSRYSISAIVESAFTSMPRPDSAALISRNVIRGWLDTIARNASAWGSSRGRRSPPIFAGRVLPVRCTRCSSLIAADGLTAKRFAAFRIELPCATARTIRSRRSRDNGAVMANSTNPMVSTSNQNPRFCARPNCSKST